MNKYAAEKIASEYYNVGIQLALQNAGLVKQANIGKGLLAATGAGAASLPALSYLGKGGGQTGKAMLEAIQSINPTHAFDLEKIKAMGSGLGADAGAVMQYLKSLGGHG